MNTYAFLLGTHPIISLAELLSFLANQKIAYGEYHWLGTILIIDIKKQPEDIAHLQNELGGIVKIFFIKERFRGKIFQLEKILTPEVMLKEFFAQRKAKINFGISVYADPEPSYAELNWLKNFAHNIKRRLKDEHSIRYVEDRGWSLSSVQVERNRLIDTGAEVALIRDQDHYYIGKTLTVQDYRAYSQRDWDKPSPDAKSGMLPPKLAQMIINLSRPQKTANIYDPFCGSGIVLQEALLLGLKIYGSDISPEAIKGTIKNLEWFIKIKRIPKMSLPTRIKEADATTVRWPSINKPETVVVTEPYLGPPLRAPLFSHQAKGLIKDLSHLYLGFFENLRRNFKSIRRIGIVLPVIKTRDGLQYLNILDDISKLGYSRRVILPERVTKKDPGISPRGGFLYSRPDQFVLREIFVFEKK
ncbi:hypothetical protein A2V68_02830 [candidate division Kazan bacterium RBG_13_50_9]|uniref:Ribosomal RNA large subunit methyltransferase K/L-like methyltransferase domain-containing protein n=1 Tax=candidate division Kazan bacterium RBG_13_50_9 TaxID=1798535 RepID=A0A1F4NSZ4_UNCK3|nr:MAG: hypothetical protein A2V68_02830 [candidate division Kazan bacterium RBG_13_50_9]